MSGLREAAEAIGSLEIPELSDGDEETPSSSDAEDETSAAADDTTSDDVAEGNESDTESDDNEESESGQVGDDESSDEATETDEGDTEPSIATLAELTEALDVDSDTIDQLTVTFNADGEETTVTLAELRQGYQKDAHYRRKTSEVAEQQRQLEAEKGQIFQGVQRQIGILGQFLQQGKQALVGDMDSAEMAALRQTDPAAWAARRQEFTDRIGQLDQVFNGLAQQYDQIMADRQKEDDDRIKGVQAEQHTKLLDALPDWGDTMRQQLMGYLQTSLGFTGEELNGVFDHRLIVLADKARRFDAMQKAGKKTKKVLRKLPKTQKPNSGAVKKKPSSKRSRFQKASARLKKSGSVRDAAAVFDAVLPEDY